MKLLIAVSTGDSHHSSGDTLLDFCPYYLQNPGVYLPHISSLPKYIPGDALLFPFFFFQIEASQISDGWSEPLSHLWALAVKEAWEGKFQMSTLGARGKHTRWEIPQILEVCSKYAGQPQNMSFTGLSCMIKKKKKSRSGDLNLVKSFMFNPEFVSNSNC